MPLPDVATDVRPSEKAIEQLRQCAQVMIVAVPEKEMEVLREGLVCLIAFTPPMYACDANVSTMYSVSVQ